jgi:Tat protein secretion system quality control protein TatD with DNase activity
MLGEIGLDYRSSPPEATPDLQKTLLKFFLEAAEEHDLAMNLHVRGASDDTLEIVTSYNVSRVISHSHSDSLESMRAMADNGYYFTIDPVIASNSNSQRLQLMREIAKEVPSDLLLTEVDTLPHDTYKPPSELLISLLEFLAKLRGSSYDEIVETVKRNSLRLIKGIQQLESFAKLME